MPNAIKPLRSGVRVSISRSSATTSMCKITRVSNIWMGDVLIQRKHSLAHTGTQRPTTVSVSHCLHSITCALSHSEPRESRESQTSTTPCNGIPLRTHSMRSKRNTEINKWTNENTKSITFNDKYKIWSFSRHDNSYSRIAAEQAAAAPNFFRRDIATFWTIHNVLRILARAHSNRSMEIDCWCTASSWMKCRHCSLFDDSPFSQTDNAPTWPLPTLPFLSSHFMCRLLVDKLKIKTCIEW